MEEDFVKVADLIDNAIDITSFICTKLDGGAKAPLKVLEKKELNSKSIFKVIQSRPRQR